MTPLYKPQKLNIYKAVLKIVITIQRNIGMPWKIRNLGSRI